jgi:glycerol-3-phosphate acyltransferase PlsY
MPFLSESYQEFLIISLICYLIGSIPFGLVFAKIMGKGDIRKKGSGNIGATNAFRVGGKLLGILTLIFDFLKAFLPLLILEYYKLHHDQLIVYGIFIVIGHMYPVWLKFQGGKGVATTGGMLFVVNIKIALLVLFCWCVAIYISRIVSLASIIAAVSLIIGSYVFEHQKHLVIYYVCLSCLVIMKHKDNIKRIKSGTEKKII